MPLMKREEVLAKLVDLLTVIEQRALGLDEPVPLRTEEGIAAAIAAFGNEALPYLYQAIELLDYTPAGIFLLHILGEIGDENTILYLITCHKQGTFLSGAAALHALRKLALKLSSEEIYEYLRYLLLEKIRGNRFIFNSSDEPHTCCQAMAEWHNPLGLETLKLATQITDSHQMPDYAIELLAAMREAHDFLRDLAASKPELAHVIKQSIEKADNKTSNEHL